MHTDYGTADRLLGEKLDALGEGKPEDLSSKAWWMWLHFLGFFVGGFTFIAGTACFYYPDWKESGEASGWLYTIGSCGFLTVDVMEIFTFTGDTLLTTNIFMSCTGSFLYVVGSIGYIPEVYDATQGMVGIWGFILGSAFIGVSQLWKSHRIGSGSLAEFHSSEKPGSFQLGNLIATQDSFTAVGVELNAGIGAWCFFFGTIMYLHGPLEGPFYSAILAIWMAGSCFFAAGSLFLGYRHAIMRV